MLYIFHVDTGTMMTFDMNLAMENVSVLQSVITKACHIPEDKQVLLISGGESLDPNQRVAKYSAGMDTNPIYLFSKSTIEAATPPSPSVHYGSDVDLQSQVDGSLNMPAAYETVVSRTQLAVQIRDVDDEEMKACERLVHDQHLQQQGWAAVVANLEDITNALRQRCDLFQDAYGNYLGDRPKYLATLQSISESLVLLAKIPLLDCLKDPSDRDIAMPLAATGGTEADLLSDSSGQNKTLFEWISSQDPHHSLNEMVEQCARATEQFDEKILDTLKTEVQQTVEAVNNPSMKEVKGLEDRLYGLDQFMSGAKKLVKEQLEMAKGFVQNQSRLSNLRDKSILPDLCDSHKKQLQVMLCNHKKLREIKKKCRMAKEELSVNLHTRLRWVMFVEKKICDIDGKLMIYHENLKRLHKRLDILRQIQDAPHVYAELIVEVVRRRMFSSQFLKWATKLAKESSHLHDEEAKCRKGFVIEMGKHFLQSLFHGFEDTPPFFATEPPADFDQYLPNISVSDIQWLKEAVPELSAVFKIPEGVRIREQMMIHTLISSVSDSIIQCDVKVGTHPLTDASSAATSEIDIIQSDCSNQFVHVDNGNVSLVDEMAACSPNTDITIKPQVVVTSDKTNFPIPQSLSETLTQEMSTEVKAKGEREKKAKTSSVSSDSKDETPKLESGNALSSTVTHVITSSKQLGETAKLQSSGEPARSAGALEQTGTQQSSGEPARSAGALEQTGTQQSPGEPARSAGALEQTGTQQSSGEPARSASAAESDIPVGERSQDSSVSKKGHKKNHLTLDTSPDMETSQEFQTADFYFDESLPSSMTDSPPKQSEKEKLSVAQQLIAKTNTILRLEQDLADSQQKLSSTREHMKCLCQKLILDLPSLRGDLTSLRDSVREEQRMFINCMKTSQQDLITNTNIFHEHLVSSNKEFICKLKVDSDKDILRLNTDIENKDGKINELNNQVSCVQKELGEARSTIKLTQTEMNKKFEELQVTCSAQKEELVREHTLGLEVELDKLQSDYKSQLDQYELDMKNMEEKLSQAQEKIKQLISEKEQITESLTQKFLEQKEEIKHILQEEFQEKEEKILSDMKEKFNKEREEQLRKDNSEFEVKLLEECQILQSRLDAEKEEALMGMKTELESAHKINVDQVIDKINSEKQQELETLKTTLKQEYDDSALKMQEKFDSEKEELLNRMKGLGKPVASSNETQTDIVEVLTLSEHQVLIKEVEHKLKEETVEQIDKAIRENDQQHERQIEDLTKRLHREKDGTAEKQIQFNEAVSKVSQEKDRIIGELRKQKAELQSRLDEQKGELMKKSSEKLVTDETVEQCHNLLVDREESFSFKESELRKEIESLKEQIIQCQGPLFTASIAPATYKEGATEVDSFDRISELETELKSKDEEIANLQSKVMALSMSASTRAIAQDKVSITSCCIGDLVLLCLDERHDQYIVFTIGTTLHFLHTECLDLLGLKTGQGESRKSWVLAEIIEKEYCQAKKPQNRFKVPVGTKFYRVKAKPWVREHTRRDTASQDPSFTT